MSKPLVTVTKLDEVFMQVNCPDDGLAKDLFDFFSYMVPNHKFMPSFKSGFWDFIKVCSDLPDVFKNIFTFIYNIQI